MRGSSVVHILLVGALLWLGLAAGVDAQIVVLRPLTVTETYVPAQIVSQPVVVSSTPMVVARPIYLQPVAVQTVTLQRVVPIVQPVNYAVAPSLVAVPAVAVPVRPVIVRSKYYVPGQPVRNIVKAITP